MTADPIFNIEGQFAKRPMFFFCDHATNHMPPEFNNLGLDARYLETHIAYDIGALRLSRMLATRLEARLSWCGFSRLLIDPNRSKDREDLMPCVSDGIVVPGNKGLSELEREDRAVRFFEPYHHQLAAEIGDAQIQYGDPLIVSIHSFTPALHTDREKRPWQVGVLWSHDEPTARKFMTALGQTSDVTIGDNAPYDARGFNYSIDRHVAPHGLRHLTLEVRQDLVGDERAITKMADLLEGPIVGLI